MASFPCSAYGATPGWSGSGTAPPRSSATSSRAPSFGPSAHEPGAAPQPGTVVEPAPRGGHRRAGGGGGRGGMRAARLPGAGLAGQSAPGDDRRAPVLQYRRGSPAAARRRLHRGPARGDRRHGGAARRDGRRRCRLPYYGVRGDGAEGAGLEAAGDLALVGPNCYGIINYLGRAALWPFAHGGSCPGYGAAILTQSGMLSSDLTMSRRSMPFAFTANGRLGW